MYPLPAPAASPAAYVHTTAHNVPDLDAEFSPAGRCRPYAGTGLPDELLIEPADAARARDAEVEAAIAGADVLLARIDRERHRDRHSESVRLARVADEAEAGLRRLDALLSPDGKFILQTELGRAVRELGDRFGRDAVVVALVAAGYPAA